MATIDDDGKIRGTVGNYVYRQVNNKGVIQSHPGPLEPKGNTVRENKRFGAASRINSVIYPYIKRSGLNMCYSYLYGRLVNYFKRVLYTDLVNNDKGEYLFLDADNNLAKVFGDMPTAEKSLNMLKVKIPEVTLLNIKKRFGSSTYMEYRLQLWHFNYGSTVSCLYNAVYERSNMSRKIEAKEIELDLSDFKDDVMLNEKLSDIRVSMEIGLLVLCFGISFYEVSNDFVSINSKKLNPAAVLGAWHLGGEMD